ncbi:MAG: hypothetical protein JJE10_05205 [Thermoleophilia bacterium]|nr:hypothetical protein [Thermoleophilia bacterium]
MKPDLPHVPLEVGAGPDNPPCPVCGEPLFPWVPLPLGTGMAHRCEACGLGVLSRSGATSDALADLDRGGPNGLTVVFENRDSLQAWLAGSAWIGLGTDRAYRFTPDSIRRLVANRDQIMSGMKWIPGASIVGMWQSGVNLFTFGQNIATGALGKAVAVRAGRPWQRGLDLFISVALTIPIAIIAVPLELLGALLHRGGRYRADFEVL